MWPPCVTKQKQAGLFANLRTRFASKANPLCRATRGSAASLLSPARMNDGGLYRDVLEVHGIRSADTSYRGVPTERRPEPTSCLEFAISEGTNATTSVELVSPHCPTSFHLTSCCLQCKHYVLPP